MLEMYNKIKEYCDTINNLWDGEITLFEMDSSGKFQIRFAADPMSSSSYFMVVWDYKIEGSYIYCSWNTGASGILKYGQYNFDLIKSTKDFYTYMIPSSISLDMKKLKRIDKLNTALYE